RYRWLSRARKLQNLARLNASFVQSGLLTRTDRLRFLRCYLRWGLHGKADWKAWWHGIADATMAKIRRNHERGRPLALGRQSALHLPFSRFTIPALKRSQRLRRMDIPV